MTTGMSAPPTGMTTRIPSSAARPTSSQRYITLLGSITTATARPMQAKNSRKFSTCSPGNEIELPVISSCNLAKRDDATGKGHRTDQSSDSGGDDELQAGGVVGGAGCFDVAGHCDQHRGQAAETVE